MFLTSGPDITFRRTVAYQLGAQRKGAYAGVSAKRHSRKFKSCIHAIYAQCFMVEKS